MLLIMGGVNGAGDTTIQDQNDGMVEVETTNEAKGVPVRWVAMPAKGWAHLIDPLSDWLLATRADTIDCRQHATSFSDGVHLTPQSNAYFAACVNAALPPHLQSPPSA